MSQNMPKEALMFVAGKTYVFGEKGLYYFQI